MQAEMADFAHIISAYEPRMQNIFCVGDGLSLAIEDPADPVKQNAYYSGVC